jgi:hypothetical protein
MTSPGRDGGAASPAELARGSFGAGRFASVAGEVRSAKWAVVLILTNEEPYLLPYEMVFHHEGDSWVEVSGSDTPGWRSTGNGRGFVTFWAEAPDNASQVTVSYGGGSAVVPVSHGYFLAVFWDVGENEFNPDALPEVTALA